MSLTRTSRRPLVATVIVAVVAAFASVPTPAFASDTPGELDSTFSGGSQSSDLDGGFDQGQGVAIQENGKILLAGFGAVANHNEVGVVRYLTNGDPDPSFDGDGIATTGFGDDTRASAIVRSGSRIIVAGSIGTGNDRDALLFAFGNDGNPDTTFGDQGLVRVDTGATETFTAIAVQPNGRIVAAGSDSSDVLVMRFRKNGDPDISFSTDGVTLTDFLGGVDFAGGSLVIQSNGKIVVGGTAISPSAGDDFAVVRFLDDGHRDPAFGQNGRVTTDFEGHNDAIGGVARQTAGIVAAGSRGDASGDDAFALARYRNDGSLDPMFGSNGTGKVVTNLDAATDDVAAAVQVTPSEKIVAAGYAHSPEDFAVVRYKPDGTLNASFGDDGVTTSDLGLGSETGYAVALQPDQRIVVAGACGSSDFCAARYLGVRL